MLIDNQKKANETASTAINTEENIIEEDYAEEEEEEEDNFVEDENDNDGNYIAGKDIAISQKEAVVNDLNEEAFSESKCPKDVADKVNLWIDSSVKQTDGYSEEESLFVDEEVNFYDKDK